MDANETLVLALAAGVSGFYALMVFLSSRRRRAGDSAGRVRPVRSGGAQPPPSSASRGPVNTPPPQPAPPRTE